MNPAQENRNRRRQDRERPADPAPAAQSRAKAGHLLPELYRVDAAHWWTVGMRRVSHALLDGIALPDGPLLELGYGAGAFLAELNARFPGRLIIGSELHPSALARSGRPAQVGPSATAADLHHLPFSTGQCAAVIALDVYDQQNVDLKSALQESWRVLDIEGILLLRVSAFSWLHGPHDAAFGTGRRYTAREVGRSLADAGLHVQRLTYANSLLFAPGVALRLLQKLGLMADVAQELNISRPLNRLLRGFLAAEARWLRQRDLPAGLSVYAVARKTDLSHPTLPGRNQR